MALARRMACEVDRYAPFSVSVKCEGVRDTELHVPGLNNTIGDLWPTFEEVTWEPSKQGNENGRVIPIIDDSA